MNKREMRRQLRSLHEGSAARDRQSALLCRRIMDCPAYADASVIGGYIPTDREANVMPVLLDALSRGKTLALPLCGKAPHMTLRRVASLEELVPGAYSIPEPPRDAPIVPAEAVGLLLVPLEGIDAEGFRLGKGGGYYDCLLPRISGITMGCALSWQWTRQVPRDAWDVPLACCADADGIHRFPNRNDA